MIFWLALLLLATPAHAEGLLEKVRGDADPTAFAPAPFSTEDFSLVWEGAPAPGVTAHLVPGSLQWVRIDELLVVPRALVEVTSSARGVIRVGSTLQPLASKTLVLVPLVSGADNSITIEIPGQGGKEPKPRLRVEFTPRASIGTNRIFLDPSCSRTGLTAESDFSSSDSWFYIGCRNVRTQGESQLKRDLDLQIFANGDSPLFLNGQAAMPSEPHRYSIRLTHSVPSVLLTSPAGRLSLAAPLPERAHSANIGAGVGPYLFQFDKGATHYRSTVPMATVYGSYSLHGTNRVVLFGAFTANSHFYSEAGTYFQFESFRFFDRRVSFQLLIGGHAISYQSPEAHLASFNFPQGFEIFYFDLFRRGFNGSLGGFIQPAINGKEYFNAWLRWGPAAWFLEMNFIYTSEQPEFVIRSYGLTAGFPLASFF